MTRATRVLYQVASHCLHYPDDELYQRLPLLRRCIGELPARQAAGLVPMLDYLDQTAESGRHVDAARHYVDVFDTKPGRCLYLTWYTDGDTRRRGASLAALKGTFRQHGFELAAGELPDYLPILLEFAALAGPPGHQLLAEFRRALDLLHTKLSEVDTPYRTVVATVLATVPAGPAARPAGSQPVVEQVGTEPVLLGYPRLGVAR